MKYVDPHASRGRFYRAYVRLSGTRVGMWFSRHVMWKVDPLLMRLTGGRFGMAWLVPTALLETRGARTGQTRRNVVIYFHDGERVTIVASKLGAAENPAWYYNILAHPDVTFGGTPFRAEVVGDGADQDRLWRLADNVFPLYARYRDMAGEAGRTVPILQLVPSG